MFSALDGAQMARKKGRRYSGRMKPCKRCGTPFYCQVCRDVGGSSGEQLYCSWECQSIAKRYTPERALEMFWSRVDKNGPGGCWIWTAARDKWGYGDLQWEHKHVQAHRLAWRLLRGEPGTMDVLHKCNKPPCCNPEHLYLGTDLENGRDRVKAGTSSKGERSHTAKLTEAQVRDIRAAYKKRIGNTRTLAGQYGVSQSAIYYIVSGRTWTHVK